jgi:hypothetical protein
MRCLLLAVSDGATAHTNKHVRPCRSKLSMQGAICIWPTRMGRRTVNYSADAKRTTSAIDSGEEPNEIPGCSRVAAGRHCL